MATAARPQTPSPDRRQEILEWHAALQGLGPAQVLGLPPGADRAAVRAAFVTLAKRSHPDSLDSPDAGLRDLLQSIFIRISEAYRQLGGDRPSTLSGARISPTSVPAAPAPKAPPPARISAPRPAPTPLDAEARHLRVAEGLREATGLMAEGDTIAAVDTLHEVLGLAGDADRRRIRLLLARAYVSQPQRRRNGVSLLEEMLRVTPHDAEALAILGALYHREGLTARAEAALRRALDSDPGHAEARIQLRAVTAALQRRRATEEARPAERRSLVARLLSFAR
jgi:tetratricopeptide (TPR) repeat protein